MIAQRNCTEHTQYTYHPEFGVMWRQRHRIYFRPRKGYTRASVKKEPGYIDVKEIDLELIKATKSREKQMGVCSGCGKEFPVEEMDGDWCRGFDGCSVKNEIREELDISNYMYKDAETLCHVKG